MRRGRRGPEPDRLERLLAGALAAGRIAIGAGIWLAPRRALRGLGFAEPSGEALLHSRIAATRDLILGIWQLRALGDRAALARATAAGATADAGDTVAFGLALGPEQTRGPALRGVPAAAAASALGTWLAARLAS